MVLFRGLRARLDGALEIAGTRRRAERAALRARLRGEDRRARRRTGVGSDPAGDAEPDRGSD